jgi:hypothetical protein
MLSKAPTFDGYILACMKRVSACSLGGDALRSLRVRSITPFFLSLSELWSNKSIDEIRAYVKD